MCERIVEVSNFQKNLDNWLQVAGLFRLLNKNSVVDASWDRI